MKKLKTIKPLRILGFLLIFSVTSGCGQKIHGRYEMQLPEGVSAEKLFKTIPYMEFDGETVKMKDDEAIVEYDYKIRGDTVDIVEIKNGQRIITEIHIMPDGSLDYRGIPWKKK
jgi:hypothetical protein